MVNQAVMDKKSMKLKNCLDCLKTEAFLESGENPIFTYDVPNVHDDFNTFVYIQIAY